MPPCTCCILVLVLGMTVPKTRVRAKAPKTKTGCKTCRYAIQSYGQMFDRSKCISRIRHIKCDEAKPACQRCASGGWTCDGYGVFTGSSDCERDKANASLLRHKNVDLGFSSPPYGPWYIPLFRLNHHEGLAFTFFRHHTAAQLQTNLQSQLWSRWAMQVSHHEPAVCLSIE